MLVLSRRIQERIVIGDEIEITVLRINGNRVRLGIHCDRRIPVRRQELPILDEVGREVRRELLTAARI